MKGPWICVESLKNQAVIADKCFVARSFFSRLKGLIGRTRMEEGEAILFPRNREIHMWFMSIHIDVAFIRSEISTNERRRFYVSSIHENVRPWKLLPLRDSKATETLELTAGTIRRCDLKVGDELCLS